MSGDLERIDEMPKEQQAAALLDALDNNPHAVDAMLERRGDRDGVVRPDSSKWRHGSTWEPQKDEPGRH